MQTATQKTITKNGITLSVEDVRRYAESEQAIAEREWDFQAEEDRAAYGELQNVQTQILNNHPARHNPEARDNLFAFILEKVKALTGREYELIKGHYGSWRSLLVRREGVKSKHLVLFQTEYGEAESEVFIRRILIVTGKSPRWRRSTGWPTRACKVHKTWEKKYPKGKRFSLPFECVEDEWRMKRILAAIEAAKAELF